MLPPGTYIRLSDDYPDSPKVVKVGGDAAWLDICAMAYCARKRTDGILPIGIVGRLSDREDPQALAKRLLEANRWHASGHDCQSCPQPDADEYVIHDYLAWQRSSDEIDDLRSKRAAAGQKGGLARAERARAQAKGKQMLEQNDGKDQADTETETEEKKKKTSSSSSAKPKTTNRGTRLPADFVVDDGLKEWFSKNCAGVDGSREHQKFVNHWAAATGSSAVKLDWRAAWRNWMLTALDRVQPAAAVNGRPRPSTPSVGRTHQQ